MSSAKNNPDLADLERASAAARAALLEFAMAARIDPFSERRDAAGRRSALERLAAARTRAEARSRELFALASAIQDGFARDAARRLNSATHGADGAAIEREATP